jgi:hypothetical protein
MPIIQLLGRLRSGGSKFKVNPRKKFARPYLNQQVVVVVYKTYHPKLHMILR